jgi:integrase
MAGSLAIAVPNPATGTIETHEWADGRTVSFYLRVPYRGRRVRVDLGTNLEGWSEQRAQVELEKVMGQIERGTWTPPTSRPRPQRIDASIETVTVTASRWWEKRRGDLAPTTRADYRWRLDYVLDYLGSEATADMVAQRVDEFRGWLQRQGLSPRSVNMVLDILAQVLDDAIDYGLLDANPARGKRRRVKVPKSRRTFLEPDMVVDMLDVAGEWEASLPEHQRYGRRALLATLCLAGPRIAELTQARRGQLDIHGGRLRVGSKTDAGHRDIEITAYLADELRSHLASVPARIGRAHGPRTPIFPSQKRKPLNASNVRNRLLNGTTGRKATPTRRAEPPIVGVVQRVNERRAGVGKMLLPDHVTPHTLRRTFASLALAAGRDPRWVMGQMGHTDSRLTLNVYAQIIQRQRVDDDLIWQLMRFPDEPENRNAGRTISPTNSPMHDSTPISGSGRITL